MTVNPQIGDIVIVSRPNVKRSQWNLAKIIDLSVSTDGLIQSASLQTASKQIITRPVQDLYPLEITDTANVSQASSPFSEIADIWRLKSKTFELFFLLIL